MSKKILQIGTDKFGDIYAGGTFQLVTKSVKFEELVIKEIRYSSGACGEDYYKESYTIHFENSTKTFEVFDVNYVIRDEE